MILFIPDSLTPFQFFCLIAAMGVLAITLLSVVLTKVLSVMFYRDSDLVQVVAKPSGPKDYLINSSGLIHLTLDGVKLLCASGARRFVDVNRNKLFEQIRLYGPEDLEEVFDLAPYILSKWDSDPEFRAVLQFIEVSPVWLVQTNAEKIEIHLTNELMFSVAGAYLSAQFSRFSKIEKWS